MRKITIYAFILAVILGALGFYYYQRNVYSQEVLKLEILGPDTAAAGDIIEYVVKYKNRGNTRLDAPELIFEYPKNSIPVDEDNLRVVKKEELGESIYPGQEESLRFKARLFGKENESVEAKASLAYHPKGLKVIYESNTTFTTILKKVALTLEFDAPSEISSGKEISLKINYFSNIESSISNLRVDVDYPAGFEFIGSNPVSLEKNSWEVGSLNKAQGGRIEIRGKLAGEIGELKSFQARIGSVQEGNMTVYQVSTKEIKITEPGILITQRINDNPVHVAHPGELLHYEIFFKNVGESALSDINVVSKLEGNAFDFQSLNTGNGNFDAESSSIVFSPENNESLRSLDSQAEGKVEFWIKLKSQWGDSDKNPFVVNKVSVSQAHQEFTTKINSKLIIQQSGYFYDVDFGNSGPLPPEAGESTTYTIIWQVKNLYSDLRNVKVKAVLPEQVRLTGRIFPASEVGQFTFDSKSGEIVWTIGDLEAGRGGVGDAPTVAFQIELIPDNFQRGSIVQLIGSARITGEDQWTRFTVEGNDSGLDTSLPDDPNITAEMGVIR